MVITFIHPSVIYEDFPGGSDGLPTMRETWDQSLGREDLLEKEMATHSSTLAWKIPWTEEPVRLQSMGWQRVWTRLSNFTFTFRTPYKFWWLDGVTSGGDGIPAELFQILKDDAVKVLHSICQQIWTTQQWPRDWKRSVFIPIPKKGNAKECSNYHTIALISHASKVMLKILQARL